MTHPYPTKMDLIEKYGYDGKQVCHMLRMPLMLKAFYATGRFQLNPPQEYLRQLIDLKLNRYTLDEAITMADGWAVELEHICKVLENTYRKTDITFEAADNMNLYAQRIVFEFCQTEIGKGNMMSLHSKGEKFETRVRTAKQKHGIGNKPSCKRQKTGSEFNTNHLLKSSLKSICVP